MRALVTGGISLALLAGCSIGPSNRPPVIENDGPAQDERPTATRQVPLPPLGEPKDSTIFWESCDGLIRERLGTPKPPAKVKFTCAKINSVLDNPKLPDTGVIRLNLVKAGQGKIPLVVINDVDGEPGSVYAARLAAELPAKFLQTFSIIGLDRRGTGESRPLACVPPDIRDQIYGLDPASDDVEPLLDAIRTAGQECSVQLKNDQGAFDSWRAAGDLEQLRIQLGMSRLHAISRGEGSRTLGLYAKRYTNNVGRIVLDGVPDPSTDALTVAEGVAEGAEATLDAFELDCAARGCPLGSDANADVTGLIERMRQSPIAVPGSPRLTPALTSQAVLAGLSQRHRWPELATAIARARDGQGAPLLAFARPMVRGTAGAAPRLDGALATICNDTETRLSTDRITAALKQWRSKYPAFGAYVAQRLVWCGPWPVRREPIPKLDIPGAPPIVVVSTATDPVTPEIGTTRTSDQLATAVRVAWQGAGHGAIGTSDCVTDKVTAFLLDGAVPKEGTLCPP